MLFHLEKSQAVLDELKSDFHGLSAQEAAIRLQKDGKNKLKAAEKTSLARRFINQILDPMIIILIIAAIVSAVVSVYEN